jgi:peroxiredoxin Q/BCP
MAGSMAPAFCLPDADMEMFELRSVLRNRIVVLHFYQRDAMPSSVRHAIAFSDREDAFARFDAIVVGVSLDDCLTHAAFRDEHGLALRLLSDPDAEVCRQYGVWQDRLADGVVRPAVHRSTFVIGHDGVVLHADHIVDVRDHAEKILKLLKPFSGRKNGNYQEHRRHA